MHGRTITNREVVHNRIKEYYQTAKDYLDRDNYQMAFNTLYKDMPVELYDISITLWSDRNMDKDLTKDQIDLMNLIKEVDIKLNPNDDIIDNNY